MKDLTKVFGIGFHKTGTTTLGAALRLLGYRVDGPFGIDDPDISRNAVTEGIRRAAEFDATQDNPWPLIYQHLDKAYPESRFILTLRDEDRWWKSIESHFGGRSTAMRQWIYGVGDPAGNEETYRARYTRHNAEVIDYFSSRPDDLLTIRVTEGDGWPELCSFLGVEIPDEPFPHINSRRDRRSSRLAVKGLKKRLGLGGG